MKQTFKIDLRHQFNSIKEGFILLALTPFALIVAHWMDKITWEDYPAVLIVILLFNLVLFLPAFYLHLVYYLENKHTLLTVDRDSELFSLINEYGSINFAFDDIQLAEQHLGIYFKNKIDHRGRWTTPWTSYGYLKLRMKNGQTYFLSSLILNVENPPFPITQTKYRFLPFIERREMKIIDVRKRVKDEQQEKINIYLERFAELPNETLLKKIDNPEKYEPGALIACQRILELRINETLKNEKHNVR